MRDLDHFKCTATIKRTEDNWNLHESARNVVNIALRQAESNYYANQLDNECGDPKQAWRIINYNILVRDNQQHDTIGEIKLDNHVV